MLPVNCLAAAPWALTSWQAAMPFLVTFAVIGLLLLMGRVPLSYNVLNVMVRWRTSLMTALAFTLVIGLLTVMLAFVNGMYALTETSGQPGNVVILAEGATDEAFSNLGMADISDLERQPGVLADGERPLSSRETYLSVNQLIENPQPGRPKRRFLQVRGIDDPVMSARVHGLALEPGGNWFPDSGVIELPGTGGQTAVAVVLGAGIARELAADRTAAARATAASQSSLDVGETFTVGDRTWIVAGLLRYSGATFDSEVWGKQSLIGEMFGKPGYTSVIVRTAGPAEAAELARFYREDYEKAAVSAQVETEYYKSLSSTNLQFLVAILVVTGIMSLGGIFGVMNTMFAAISQRTKDIGVLRLLGYRRRQILISFLLESLVLAVIGGLLGCAAGCLSDGWQANSVVSGGQGGGKFVTLRLTVDAGVLAVGMFLSAVMGFFGGLIPALSAMRLSALEALR